MMLAESNGIDRKNIHIAWLRWRGHRHRHRAAGGVVAMSRNPDCLEKS